MDKVKIGIPRSMYYYFYGRFWKYFFEYLDVPIIVSPKTNKEIIKNGSFKSIDEMCMSLKIFMGHIDYLKDKCDYILIPRIDNYGYDNQTCTNFLSLYDLVSNVFDVNIINYNIDYTKKQREIDGLYYIGACLKKTRKQIYHAYKMAKIKEKKDLKKEIIYNYNKLKSNKIKILVVAHPYNLYDDFIGKPIIKMLDMLNVCVIYCDKFESDLCRELALDLSSNLYWKYSRENIGAIKLVEDKIDGIIFLSTFPCGPDSLVNELMIRKTKKPCLNLILDDMDSLTGIETRIESFIDILEKKIQN